MNSRMLALIGCLCLSLPLAVFAALTPQREAEIKSKFYQSGGFAFDIRALSQEERLFIENLAREQIPKDIYEGGGTSLATMANQTLVLLGDEETTRRFLAYYMETGRDPEPLIRSYNPKVIEALSADLFRNDPWPIPRSEPDNDQPVMPPSYRVSIVIGMMLQGGPAFSKEVNEWAIRNFKYDPQKGVRSIYDKRNALRNWWRENERFFKTGDYKSVKPGEELFGR